MKQKVFLSTFILFNRIGQIKKKAVFSDLTNYTFFKCVLKKNK
jgi:hypothetical protein